MKKEQPDLGVDTAMVEPMMFFAIGFFLSVLLALPFIPVIHRRAVRLTTRRLEAATPSSIVEIRADRDHLRAGCALAIRKLEIQVDQLKAKTAVHLVEIAKRGSIIEQLKEKFGEKNAAVLEMQETERSLRDQLRDSEERLVETSSSLRKTELTLSDDEQEKAKLLTLLADTGRRLEDRDIRIEQLENELKTAHDTMADLRREVTAAHRWLADNLHHDISTLQHG
jgi:chromosome segregation ATPase